MRKFEEKENLESGTHELRNERKFTGISIPGQVSSPLVPEFVSSRFPPVFPVKIWIFS
jgi:hypothetical protein